MSKRRIWQRDGNVFLRETDPITEEDRVREFWVTGSRGYVWEYDPRADFQRRQVCEHLAHLGNTLMSTPDRLLDLIRREYRRAVAAERRERKRYG